jgi:hypothetical protein
MQVENWTHNNDVNAAAYNSTFAIGGVTCSALTFLQDKSFCLRTNFLTKYSANRKSANR